MRLFQIILPSLLAISALADQTKENGIVLSAEVTKHARELHAGFKGETGYVAQFGDSITYSMAFWGVMNWTNPAEYLKGNDGMPKTPQNSRWRDTIKGSRDNGVKFANYSGWRVPQLVESVGAVLKREKPAFAIIMIGTNDISKGKVPENYGADLKKVITRCQQANCIPILNTIPPRRDRDKEVEAINAIIKKLAKTEMIPLVDFHAGVLSRRPGNSWDGTLISKDGVHPSGGKSNIYTPENLKNCGYALRNWLNFLMVRKLHFALAESKPK
jgi:lysophospholipase L1-like esterase